MMLLHKFLIKRKKLIKFCFLFCGEYKKAFKVNFLFCEAFYKKKCISNSKILLLSIKKIIPLFSNLSKNKGNFLFSATESLYLKTFQINKYTAFAKKLVTKKQGLFFNFFVKATRIAEKWDFLKNPALLLFLNFEESKDILYESKRKNIPSIGLTTVEDNSGLVEYPILVNNFYFHTIYFFVQIFFKLLTVSWSKEKRFKRTTRLSIMIEKKRKKSANKTRRRFASKRK